MKKELRKTFKNANLSVDMRVLYAKEVQESTVVELKKEVRRFGHLFSRPPLLALILLGSDGASVTYVSNKRKLGDEIGIEHRDFFLPEETSESELLSLIDSLNGDDSVDGILVQLPLPKHISEEKVISRISHEKDVDGFSPYNMGLLALGEEALVPCTAKGILTILEYYKVPLSGKSVTIIGRSNIVGRPLSLLLSKKGVDATVTLCHSKTKDLERYTKDSDVVIVAVGRPKYFDSSMAKNDAVVIDVGITRVSDSSRKRGYRIEGDVDFSSFENTDAMVTPVPGGVGVMTVTSLMENLLKAAFLRKGVEA